MSFHQLQLDAALLRAVQKLGYEQPTPIQREAIPPALAGRDVLASAKTGSGKTAAFVLPIVQRLAGKPRGTTRALVLAPTRELAVQIHDSLRQLASHTPLTAAAIFGGVPMPPQEQALRRGVDVVVATPGRLLDHLGRPYARLSNVEVLVLDEADRMLDMGFLPDVKRILGRLPAQRQTLLFSATMPDEIVRLSREMMKDPVTVRLVSRTAPVSSVSQKAYPVPGELKSALLTALVKGGQIGTVIAFTRTKHRANRLADYLVRNGVPAERIHGMRSQSQRTEALRGFKAGRFRVLVATDLAARGIDVQELSHVVNFDVPNSPEDYVHRVGRTGRADATGEAFVFVAPDEEGDMRRIERTIGARIPRVTLTGFDYSHRPQEKLEIPLADRIAAMRAQKQRARENQQRRQQPSARPAAGRRASTPRAWDARSFEGDGRRGPSIPGRQRFSRDRFDRGASGR